MNDVPTQYWATSAQSAVAVRSTDRGHRRLT
jgi:hypothetical protein